MRKILTFFIILLTRAIARKTAIPLTNARLPRDLNIILPRERVCQDLSSSFLIVSEAGALNPNLDSALHVIPFWGELSEVLVGVASDPKSRHECT